METFILYRRRKIYFTKRPDTYVNPFDSAKQTRARANSTHTRLSIIIDVLTRSTFRARKYCLANNRTLLTAVRAKSSLSHARRSAFPPSHPRSLIHNTAVSLTPSPSLSLFSHSRSSSIASDVVRRRRRRFYRRRRRRRHRRVLPFPRSLGDANINNYTRVRSV